jgi:hypothetical protein
MFRTVLRATLASLVVVLLTPNSGLPQCGEALEISPRDDLTIEMTLDTAPLTALGTLRFCLASVPGDSLRLVSGGIRANPTLRIDPAQIVLRPEAYHPAGLWIDRVLEIQDVRRAGVYKGDLLFHARSGAGTDSSRVQLTLLVHAPVEVKSIEEPGPTVRLARCWRHVKLGCWLTEWFTHAAATRQEWPLHLRNETTEDVDLVGGNIVAVGAKSGFQGYSGALHLEYPAGMTLRARQTGKVTVLADANELPPDLYSGQIELLFDRDRHRLSIPLVLTVRRGAGLVLLFLLVGILLGRTTKEPANRSDYSPAQRQRMPWPLEKVSAFASVYPKEKELGPAVKRTINDQKDVGVSFHELIRDWRSWLRPVLFLILLLALLATGAKLLYVDNHTFGSVFDYVAALTWGFGADIVNSKLGSLPT